MPLRDDFGGTAGTPGGYRGGAGGLGNGGLGGGMGGGGGGGGFGGGMTQNTGMRTGAVMPGTSMYGRPGGNALGYGMNPNAAYQNAMNPKPIGGIIQNIMNRNQPQVGLPPVGMPPQQPVGLMPPQLPTYNPLLSILTRPPTMQGPPQPQPNFGTLAPGQPKYQDRVPSGVGQGPWRGQAGGPHWSNNGTYSGYSRPTSTGGGGGW